MEYFDDTFLTKKLDWTSFKFSAFKLKIDPNFADWLLSQQWLDGILGKNSVTLFNLN